MVPCLDTRCLRCGQLHDKDQMMAYTRDDSDTRENPKPQGEPVSSLERVRLAEIKAQREAEAEAAAFAKDFIGRCFTSLDKVMDKMAKADMVRMVKD